MFTVDIHTHILPEKIPDFAKKFGYDSFIQIEHTSPGCAKLKSNVMVFRDICENCWSPEVRIKECNALKVDVQVLSTVPVMFSYWAKPKHNHDIARFFNDHIAEVVQSYPHRFAGLGTLPMQGPGFAVKELERCIKTLHLSGVQIGTHVNSWNLDAPELFPVFQAAEELGAAVFIHPWNMMGREKMTRYWLPWLVGMPAESARAICSMIFGGVFERLPGLRVAFAHGGGSFPATIGRIEHGFFTRPDLCAKDNDKNPRHYLGKFYLDSIVHDPKMLNYIIDLIGAERVAMGSDYPFPLGETKPGKLIRSMPFDEHTKMRLLSGTALEWLGTDKQRFTGAVNPKSAVRNIAN